MGIWGHAQWTLMDYFWNTVWIMIVCGGAMFVASLGNPCPWIYNPLNVNYTCRYNICIIFIKNYPKLPSTNKITPPQTRKILDTHEHWPIWPQWIYINDSTVTQDLCILYMANAIKKGHFYQLSHVLARHLILYPRSLLRIYYALMCVCFYRTWTCLVQTFRTTCTYRKKSPRSMTAGTLTLRTTWPPTVRCPTPGTDSLRERHT